jgi:hypothetical protein
MKQTSFPFEARNYNIIILFLVVPSLVGKRCKVQRIVVSSVKVELALSIRNPKREKKRTQNPKKIPKKDPKKKKKKKKSVKS